MSSTRGTRATSSVPLPPNGVHFVLRSVSQLAPLAVLQFASVEKLSHAGTKLPVTSLHRNCGEDDPLLCRFRRTYDSNGIAVARNRETVDIGDDISLTQAASIRRVSPNDGLDDDLIHHVRECEPERSGLDVHVSFPSVRPIRAESRRYGQAVGAHRPF